MAKEGETIQFGDMRRRIVLVYPGYANADMTWEQVIAEPRRAREDPTGHERRRGGRRPWWRGGPRRA
jgi:hypothetical protein